MINEQGLNKKQRLLCREYMIDMNGRLAAIRAGYSPKTAEQQACRLLSKVKVKKFISQLVAERNERVKIDSDYVLERLVQIDKMDVANIMQDCGTLKPIKEWPEIWRQFISHIDVSEIFSGRGEERNILGVLKKVKWPDKVKNLELMGKHVNVQAFREQCKVEGEITLSESLKRMAEQIDGKTGGLPSNVGKRNNREQQQVGSRRCE
jgi:phage terminase small subunit